MKKIFVILLSALTLVSCGSNGSNNNKANQDAQAVAQAHKDDVVEVLYFHAKQRCVTCLAIQSLTEEMLQTKFAQAVKDGKVVYKVVDISTPEGEKIADQYEVTWSSLFVNKFDKGVETKNNLTEMGFAYAKNTPDVFKAEFTAKLNSLL